MHRWGFPPSLDRAAGAIRLSTGAAVCNSEGHLGPAGTRVSLIYCNRDSCCLLAPLQPRQPQALRFPAVCQRPSSAAHLPRERTPGAGEEPLPTTGPAPRPTGRAGTRSSLRSDRFHCSTPYSNPDSERSAPSALLLPRSHGPALSCVPALFMQ